MADIKAKGSSNGDGGKTLFSITLHTKWDDAETADLQDAVATIKATEAYKTFMAGARDNSNNFVRFLLAFTADNAE